LYLFGVVHCEDGVHIEAVGIIPFFLFVKCVENARCRSADE